MAKTCTVPDKTNDSLRVGETFARRPRSIALLSSATSGHHLRPNSILRESSKLKSCTLRRHERHPALFTRRVAPHSPTHSVLALYLSPGSLGNLSHPAHSHTSPRRGMVSPRATGNTTFTGCGPACDVKCAHLKSPPFDSLVYTPPSTTRFHRGAPPSGALHRACALTLSRELSVRSASAAPIANTNKTRGTGNCHPNAARAVHAISATTHGQTHDA